MILLPHKRIVGFLVLFSLSVTAIFPIFTHTAQAATSSNEISYGTITALSGNTVTLTYKGPSGDNKYTCSLTNLSCKTSKTTTTSFSAFTTVALASSPDKTYAINAVSPQAVQGKYFYGLYQDKKGLPSFVTLLPFNEKVQKAYFTKDGSTIVLVSDIGTIARYNISSKKITTTSLGQTDLPLFSISPNGKFASAYSYTDKAHRIWNLETGKKSEISAKKPVYVEFSEDGESAIFTDSVKGFGMLFSIRADKGVFNTSNKKQLTNGEFEVFDYIFNGDDVFFLANKDDVYDWSIYKINPDGDAEDAEKISAGASYGDYIKSHGDFVLFPVIEGKQQNIAVYDTSDQKLNVLRPKKSSATKVTSETIKLRKANAVLWSSSSTSKTKPKAAFIWLHGGPQRQTSENYHSYSSYAVYDELLDRLTQSGAIVLKLDYIGSEGYGADYINALKGNVGKKDVTDVLNAHRYLTDKYEDVPVYLIGNSYGGYLALRGLMDEPAKFAGAISINGVTDWLNLVARIPSSPFSVHFDGPPGKANYHLYEEAGISDKLTRLKDEKVLLVYGKKDSTVPTWQTTEFYDIAKLYSPDNVSLVAYENEDHILRSRKTLNDLCEKVTKFSDLKSSVCK